jgi:hypothetical protein
LLISSKSHVDLSDGISEVLRDNNLVACPELMQQACKSPYKLTFMTDGIVNVDLYREVPLSDVVLVERLDVG